MDTRWAWPSPLGLRSRDSQDEPDTRIQAQKTKMKAEGSCFSPGLSTLYFSLAIEDLC